MLFVLQEKNSSRTRFEKKPPIKIKKTFVDELKNKKK